MAIHMNNHKIFRMLLTISIAVLLLYIVSIYMMLKASNNSNSYTNIDVYIDSYGIMHVSMEIKPIATGMTTIHLPIPPVIASIDVAVDGRTIPFIICDNESYICVPIEEGISIIKINYIANTSLSQGIFEVIVKPYTNVSLTIAPNIILLGIPTNIFKGPEINNGNMTIVFLVTEPYTIRYMVRSSIEIPSTSTTFTTSIPQYGEAPKTSTTSLDIHSIIIVIAVVIAIAIIMLYIFIRRRHVHGEESEVLGDIDTMIIKSLEKKGGSAFQSELQRAIPIPKTTLWRHIKKLERMGIVRIEKVGNQNRVVLVKRR
ncbi:conserved hypothetical protein [Ignisphaera aggregans DSM 17230]|uniref:Winged helix-turn-helix transcriptional regulator n=1 Tax=Ignisphaera aggregans (strain DSM 17230 / JCM 13409 / AQ1.S1) TaxID=583356 RepID=E0SRE5_IGNAA|nr:conserved hypothetical protein [Ignisphaera aggregans DSM 17230]